MSASHQTYKLYFENDTHKDPCLWQMARRYPEVEFDILRASVTETTGIMFVVFDAEEEDITKAIGYLTELGIRAEPVKDEQSLPDHL